MFLSRSDRSFDLIPRGKGTAEIVRKKDQDEVKRSIWFTNTGRLTVPKWDMVRCYNKLIKIVFTTLCYVSRVV